MINKYLSKAGMLTLPQRIVISLASFLIPLVTIAAFSWVNYLITDEVIQEPVPQHDMQEAKPSYDMGAIWGQGNVGADDKESENIIAGTDEFDSAVDEIIAKRSNKKVRKNIYTYLKEDLNGLFEFCVFLGIAAFMVVSLLRDYYQEPSSGWKRLSIVGAAFGSGIFTYAYSDEDLTIGWLITPITFVLSMFLILSSKKIFNWIKDGFEEDKDRGPLLSSDNVARPQKEKSTHNPNNEAALSAENDRSKLPDASFWSRFWARSIDISFVTLIAVFTVTLLSTVFTMRVSYLNVWAAILIAGLIMSFTAFIYEYLSLLFLEATLGKVIFGIVVTNIHGTPTNNRDCLIRSWRILKNCLGFFIFYPFLQFWFASQAKKDLALSKTTKWDKSLYKIKQSRISTIRWIMGIVSACILILVTEAISVMDHHAQKKIIGESLLRMFSK